MKRYLLASAATLVCAALVLTPVLSWAQVEANSAHGTPPTITFEAAVVRALNAAPDLRASEENARAAAARIRQARVWPNPEVEIEAENIAGSGPFDGFGAGEYSVSVGQRLERGGKRRARMALARSQQEMTRIEAEQVRLDVIFEVQRSYVEALSAAATMVNAEGRARLAATFETTVDKRVQSARDPAVAGQRAAIQVLEARADLDRARRKFAIAKQRLASFWGNTTVDFSLESARLFDVSGGDFAADPSAIEATPDLLLGVATESAAEAAVAVERAIAKQDLKVRLGMRHLRETEDVAAILSFSVPLAFFDTNKGNIDRANAERSRAAWEAEGARRRLQRELGAQAELLQAAKLEALTIRDGIIPKAKAALEAAGEGYKRGAFTYLDVLDAERTLTNLQAREIAALTKLHMARAALDRLTARYWVSFPGEERKQ